MNEAQFSRVPRAAWRPGALRGNRFEKLKGDRAGYHSIRVNDQWRITFRIEENRALDVTIEDCH